MKNIKRKGLNNHRARPAVNIDITTLPDMECPHCRGIYFQAVVQVKRVSAIVSPKGVEEQVVLNHLRCAACGWVVNQVEPAKSGHLNLPVFSEKGQTGDA